MPFPPFSHFQKHTTTPVARISQSWKLCPQNKSHPPTSSHFGVQALTAMKPTAGAVESTVVGHAKTCLIVVIGAFTGGRVITDKAAMGIMLALCSIFA